jgi:hypothetical protein
MKSWKTKLDDVTRQLPSLRFFFLINRTFFLVKKFKIQGNEKTYSNLLNIGIN